MSYMTRNQIDHMRQRNGASQRGFWQTLRRCWRWLYR
ncbi:hypothetical protein C7443_102531 [Plasticicumulans acidivorans]|uniref:Uncharacterized protein n=1 Tax=Plasticicumulans acidivorans TaxID=886464 RepID=A0A317N3Y9_9GAMM|nr:hypothetical protein C7443_102531 [Plasticicumulans acidivorans]